MNDRVFLYYFEVVYPDEVDLNTVEQEYKAASGGGARAYARFNVQSPYLYVGGSQHIAQRTKEHLGFGSAKTYALHLAHWSPGLRLALRLTCARYSNDVNSDLTQALEDALWDSLKPMFGRRGRR